MKFSQRELVAGITVTVTFRENAFFVPDTKRRSLSNLPAARQMRSLTGKKQHLEIKTNLLLFAVNAKSSFIFVNVTFGQLSLLGNCSAVSLFFPRRLAL